MANTTVKIICYKISSNLNLITLASYFNINYDKKTRTFLILNHTVIASIIKIHSKSKFLFIYEFGCIVFVDFSSDEIYSALSYLETIAGVMDYKLLHQFNESLILTINNQVIKRINDLPCELDYSEDVLSIACGLISKSTALSVAESQISVVLDNAENIVNYLQKAKLRINTKKFVSSIAQMARFQYSAIKSFGVFNRSSTRNTNSKSFHNTLSRYYEIDDRNIIIERKIDQVNRLIRNHTTLSYNRQEFRLLVFECILLAMFSLPHLIDLESFFTYLLH